MKLKLMSSHTNILAKEVGNVSLEKDYLQFSVKSTQFWFLILIYQLFQ